jgi:septal ring factor EnvC (AmiA/AmiB activator)
MPGGIDRGAERVGTRSPARGCSASPSGRKATSELPGLEKATRIIASFSKNSNEAVCRETLCFSYFRDSLVVDHNLRKADTSHPREEVVMPAAARKFELEPQMQERTVLDEKIDHLQEDITDLKADVRRIDAKFDSLSTSLSEHRLETEKSLAKLRDETKDSISALRIEMSALRIEMRDTLAKCLGNRNAQIAWTVSTIIAMAGVTFTIAKYFSTP